MEWTNEFCEANEQEKEMVKMRGSGDEKHDLEDICGFPTLHSFNAI